ncbi:MAG: lysylphosphatidylglycerol synthase transmembrane domain-containing protein [Longimicrobiales bacterium]
MQQKVPTLGWFMGVGLFLALVLLVHFGVGWSSVLAPWLDTPLELLVTAYVLVLGSYALRTARVHLFFTPDTAGDFPRSFRLILLHNLFNNLLPMRSGEASFPILMKRDFGIPFSRSVPGLFYLRLLDLHFLLVLGGAALSWRWGWAAWMAVAVLLPLPFLAFLLQERIRRTLSATTGRRGEILAKGMTGLPRTRAVFWWTWLWTGVNWAVKLLVFAWILRAFTSVPLGPALLGSVAGEISSVLPIHGVAGAGTYEAGVAAGLLPFGVGPETALRGGVNLHLFVLGASLLSGALALFLPVRPRHGPGDSSLGPPGTGEPRLDS